MPGSRRALAAALTGCLALTGAACGHSSPRAAPPAPTSTSPSTAVATTEAGYGPGRHTRSYQVRGTTRTAVVVMPASVARPVPVVFVFHGHGGSGAAIERTVRIEDLWPEAVVVYPDGLPGHKGVTDPAGTLPGWQTAAGEAGDADLAFYDAMLAGLRASLPVDADRLYVMGHSNGSAFTSLLLNQRGAAVAATANISAQPGEGLLAGDPVRSMFLSMGMSDPIVPYDVQKLSIPLAERKLGVDPKRTTVSGYLRTEHGAGNVELDVYVHPGGHPVPGPVPALIVDFFKRHTLSGG